jgi:hypothetical protein
MDLRQLLKDSSGLREAGTSVIERTPTTPIRLGRSAPGGLIALFVLIGFIVVAIALLT